ncbi:MmcQ/YjbR family DNA-binding protein [Poseidonibacter antarcticus]|uniref:MmcQ/YjbR family DNA-binding protein n=1 Tax=Poseidonibacter antarcticus TaxID=2478538 RepID=UPI000EF486EC|nr:MmcQ/YjbR family DNA-binding protein [Poseidonibacter antarcticus]
MNLEKLEEVLLSKNKATKEFPFDDKVMVFKVKNKMFALLLWKESPLRINLKCDPIDALAFREIYDCVKPGYHMNKKHWNTIHIDGSMEDRFLIDMIDDSYNLVVSKLTKKEKFELGNI